MVCHLFRLFHLSDLSYSRTLPTKRWLQPDVTHRAVTWEQVLSPRALVVGRGWPERGPIRAPPPIEVPNEVPIVWPTASGSLCLSMCVPMCVTMCAKGSQLSSQSMFNTIDVEIELIDENMNFCANYCKRQLILNLIDFKWRLVCLRIWLRLVVAPNEWQFVQWVSHCSSFVSLFSQQLIQFFSFVFIANLAKQNKRFEVLIRLCAHFPLISVESRSPLDSFGWPLERKCPQWPPSETNSWRPCFVNDHLLPSLLTVINMPSNVSTQTCPLSPSLT